MNHILNWKKCFPGWRSIFINYPAPVSYTHLDVYKRQVEDFGIDSIVSVKTATADAIMSYVRARKNSQGSANVETMYQLICLFYTSLFLPLL